MKRAWVVLSLCLLGGAARGAPVPPPLSAFGKLPTIEDIQISPDGSRFAVIATNGDARSVEVFETTDRKLIRVIRAGAAKVSRLQWAGADDLIVTTSSDRAIAWVEGSKREWFLATDINTRTWKVHGLLDTINTDPRPGGADLNTIDGLPMVRTKGGKTTVFVEGVHFTGGVGATSLYEFDPRSGTATLAAQGQETTDSWLVDANGKPLAESRYDPKARRWTLRIRRGDELRTVKSFEDDIEHPSIMGLGRDGRSVLLSVGADVKDDSPRENLVEMAPGAADWGAPVVDRDFADAIFDPVSQAFIGYDVLAGDDERDTFFDPKDQAAWNGTVKAYPNARVDLVSMSADHHKLVVKVDSPNEGPAYALVDIDKHSGDWLGGAYDAAAESMALKSPLAFKASDGLALTGYLTAPKGGASKNLPLVVFPHGGPADRDEPGYNWWAQAMASRGYAVLQVNYRGSSGFGWDFEKAGFGEYGRRMQTDLSDGVRYLAAQGIIDPKRVCIVGASYGGYAALAGAAIDTGVYRCAVSVAGISDLKRDISWSSDVDHGNDATKRYWLRYMGVDRVSDPKLDEISPLKRVSHIEIPILLIHGEDDTVVDIARSRLIYEALKKAGKPVEFITLPHENHHLLTGATRLRMLEATMDFLERNNPAP